MEQTFCWEDGNKSAGHYMVLVNDEGVETLQVNANGECVTGVVEPGDYEMRVYHDAGDGEECSGIHSSRGR